MSEEEVDLLLSGLEDNQGQINYEGTKFLVILGSTDCVVYNFCMWYWPSIKSGTWNIPEHPGTFRNIPEHSGTSPNIK